MTKVGRPPYKKTPELAKQVEAMAAYGITHKEIAACLDISEDTLQRHYRKELDTGSPKAIARVAERLYKKCMNDDTQSIIFFLKTRGRWAETIKQEVTGKDGGAIKTETQTSDMDKMIIENYLKSKGIDNA